MQKTAKYKQIEDYIKQEISRKNLQIGDQIMTEEQLCQRFNFSRMTINKALNHLSTLGYIERIPGRGSFVTAPHIQKENLGTGSSFTEDMKSIGLKAGARLYPTSCSVPMISLQLPKSWNWAEMISFIILCVYAQEMRSPLQSATPMYRPKSFLPSMSIV